MVGSVSRENPNMSITCQASCSVLRRLQSATPLVVNGREGRDRWALYSSDNNSSWARVRRTEIIWEIGDNQDTRYPKTRGQGHSQ